MAIFRRGYSYILLIGDIVVLYVSLWITLIVRYLRWPGGDLLQDHLAPFSLIFIVWLIVFYIGGLYERRTLILRDRLPRTILRVHLINSVIAVLFFYLIPYFEITPKLSLFIYLVISFGLLIVWRLYGFSALAPRQRQNAILIASGEELRELRDEVNHHPHYSIQFISSVDLDRTKDIDFTEEVVKRIFTEDVSVAVVDFKAEQAEPILSTLYNLIFSNIIFIDMHKLYEDVFDRIPLSLIGYSWFLDNISLRPKFAYDFLKRLMDIIVAIPFGLISLVLYPFVILAIKLDDGGPLFFFQERIGKNGQIIRIVKFRTMTTTEAGIYDEAGKTKNVVTKVGGFMRKTRIDELPQLWNVIRGDQSLIGPRPELPSLVKKYEQQIPYYGIRHLIKPGLSGWAQLHQDNHPHHAVAVEDTKEKLSYDLYYLKNRSFLLDIRIALKTVKKLLSFAGI
jgi:exopolysaccharide biosynthesis polyprenyl glycosylphosphotransferase